MSSLIQTAFKLMRLVGRLSIFLFLALLALSNTQVVSFHLFPGLYWDAPLILVLFAAFVFGIVVTLVSGISLRKPKKTT